MQADAGPIALDAKTILLAALAIVSALYLVVLVRGLRRHRAETGETNKPTPGGILAGFVTNFFDTLGIGSFATSTALFPPWKMVRGERIPRTLHNGHTLPPVAQGYIFTPLVPVESTTLILMIAAAVLGSWLGAGVVARWQRSRVQTGMGIALLVAATLMVAAQLSLMPGGGTELRLTGVSLAIGVIGNFALGALMTMGIGLYAPCMILIYLLGMDPKAALPIMMGSCAFLMPTASARFIRERAYDARTVIGLAIGGILAVLIAAFLVKSLPLMVLRWRVAVVVLYTAVTLLPSPTTDRPRSPVPDVKPTA